MTLDWTEFFINFPRQKLPQQVKRSQMLSALLEELDGSTSASAGQQAFRLVDLGDLADEGLASMTPVLLTDPDLIEEQGYLWKQAARGEKGMQLFPLEEPARLAFECFDGNYNLAAIALKLSTKLGWEFEKAFAYTRGMFLALVFAGVCFPKEPLAP